MTKTKKTLIMWTNVPEYKKVGFRTGLWFGGWTHFWDVAVRPAASKPNTEFT
jgi:hypothetical protein